jgi:tetratricopeptide (TPR) repeat protein
LRAAAPVSKHAAVSPLADQEQALLQGRVDDAITSLHNVVSADPRNGAAHLLLCRAFYAEEIPDSAVSECESALETLGSDSKAQDWMGRAYGLKADRSGPLAGYKLASKVRVAFEASVQLDPANGDAADDLSEYYVGAPSMLGGGMDKARDLANRIQAKLPQQAHRTLGLVAEKEHNYAAAEQEFKAAIAVAGRSDAWFDLGHYYSRREQKDDAVAALKQAIAADRAHGETLVDVASVLIKIKREPGVAQQALLGYLASPAKTDGAPAFKADTELGKLLEMKGDKAGAQAQYEKALALAREYAPAKKALARL